MIWAISALISAVLLCCYQALLTYCADHNPSVYEDKKNVVVLAALWILFLVTAGVTFIRILWFGD